MRRHSSASQSLELRVPTWYFNANTLLGFLVYLPGSVCDACAFTFYEKSGIILITTRLS